MSRSYSHCFCTQRISATVKDFDGNQRFGSEISDSGSAADIAAKTTKFTRVPTMQFETFLPNYARDSVFPFRLAKPEDV